MSILGKIASRFAAKPREERIDLAFTDWRSTDEGLFRSYRFQFQPSGHTDFVDVRCIVKRAPSGAIFHFVDFELRPAFFPYECSVVLHIAKQGALADSPFLDAHVVLGEKGENHVIIDNPSSSDMVVDLFRTAVDLQFMIILPENQRFRRPLRNDASFPRLLDALTSGLASRR